MCRPKLKECCWWRRVTCRLDPWQRISAPIDYSTWHSASAYRPNPTYQDYVSWSSLQDEDGVCQDTAYASHSDWDRYRKYTALWGWDRNSPGQLGSENEIQLLSLSYRCRDIGTGWGRNVRLICRQSRLGKRATNTGPWVRKTCRGYQSTYLTDSDSYEAAVGVLALCTSPRSSRVLK